MPESTRGRTASLVAVAAGAALAACAVAVALPFRARVLAQASPHQYSWDGALHILAGLDLWDDLRRLALLDAAARLVTGHWWGPAWALLTAPLYALLGTSLATATLPSLAAFALAPAAAWLFARRATRTTGALAAPLVLLLFLRAPVLVEMSAWPMFESVGGLAALLAWLLFARGGRADLCGAFAIAAALFFLKYHYGVFLGATLLFATVARLPREERAALASRAWRLLRAPAVAGLLGLALLLSAARLATEKSPRPLPVPSISNVAWGVLVLGVLASLGWRRRVRAAFRELPVPLRDFALFAGAVPLLWLLDPANVRAFWRQIRQDWVADPPGPLTNARDLASFFRDDLVSTSWTLPLLLGGLLLAILLGRRDRTLPFAALFCVWPPVAMCFSAFPLEPRFLGCLLPTLYACSAAGLVLLVAEIPARFRLVGAVALLAALALPLPFAQRRLEDTLTARVRFGYPNSAGEERFTRALVPLVPEGVSCVIALPPGLKLGPTLRLALRMRERALAPGELIAADEPAHELLRDAPRRVPRLILATGQDEGTVRAAVEDAGYRVVSRRAGPLLPDGTPFFLFILEHSGTPIAV